MKITKAKAKLVQARAVFYKTHAAWSAVLTKWKGVRAEEVAWDRMLVALKELEALEKECGGTGAIYGGSNPDAPTAEVVIKTLMFLLRQVFYTRYPVGNRVDEIIQQHFPDLWKDVYSWLEGENKSIPALAPAPAGEGEKHVCNTCRYYGKIGDEYPCNKCTFIITDRWEARLSAPPAEARKEQE